MNPHAPRRSLYVDAALAAAALDMVFPLLAGAVTGERYGQSGALYVVIMDPASHPSVDDFEDAVLYERGIGPGLEGAVDYRSFARAKAKVSWLTRADTHALQTQPHRLARGDSTLWGSVCFEDLVVGVSGAMPWFDEAYALATAACVRALAKERAAQAR